MTHTGLLILGTTFLAQAGSGPAAQAASGGNNQLLLWAIVLFGMAVALFFAELFVPSGGVIGMLSAACLIGGIFLLFRVDTGLGLFGAMVALISLPFAFALGLWVWPNTPIGRALTLGGNDPDDTSDLDGQAPPDTTGHESGITEGTEGKSLTELRPVGTCLLDGRREECLSMSGVIEPGERVKVVSADGMQIKVQRV